MFWWIFLGAAALFVYYYIVIPHSYWSKRKIPHLKPVPLLGNMYNTILQTKTFTQSIQDMYRWFPNDRYFGIHQFLLPTLVLRDRELIKQICIKDFEHFMDHRTFISEDTDPLFGKNLFSLKGQKWKNMRSTLSPAFTGSKMRSMFVLIKECADQFVNYYLNEIENDRNGIATVEMKEVFTRFANDVIASTAFGLECNSLTDKDNQFYLRGKEATTFTGRKTNLKFFGYSISPLLMKLLKIRLFSEEIYTFFRRLVLDTMAMREKQGIVRPDMINILMLAKKGNLKHDNVPTKNEDSGFADVGDTTAEAPQKQKFELSDDDLIAQALLFFVAGFDTVSTLMCFVSHELAVNVDYQRRLQQEIDTTVEESGGCLTYEAITKMKYLDMVMSETLRKWPPAILVDRECIKPYVIESTKPNETPAYINKHDVLWLPIYSIHHDPDYFPDPEKFDPERFSAENVDAIKPFTFIPFGVGPRNCIGSRFALLEAKTIVVSILMNFDIIVVEKTQIPLKLRKDSFNMYAEHGFWLGFKQRVKSN